MANKINVWSKNWLLPVTVVLIAIAFSATAILGTSLINKNLKILSVHPFAVSQSIYTLKNSVSDSKIRLSRLVMYNTKDDVDIVQEAINQKQQVNLTALNYIDKNYLGPNSEAKLLRSLVNELELKEQDYLQNATARTLTENEIYITENLEPIYQKIDENTGTMLNFITNTVLRLTEESNTAQSYIVCFAVLISIILIILAILYQRSATRKIQDREAYYRDFLFKVLAENIDTAFIIYNVDTHNIEFVSTNTERTLGIDSHDLENGKVDLFAYCDSQECAELKETFKSEILHTRMQSECLFSNPLTNEKKYMKLYLYPTEEAGRVNRYILSIVDQSEVRLNQQILRDALVNAQNANAAKGNFLSRMSHEIRTPMNAIIGMSTIATSALNNPAKLENCLAKIMLSSKHLLMLINDILDMSKIENGKFSMTNESFALVDVISNVSNMIYDQTQSKNQKFDVVVDVPFDILTGDCLRLNQILINLLSNSVKYTQEGGKIKLLIKEVPYKIKNKIRLQFTVSDNGIGMSEEFLNVLFTPFEQEGRMSGGTGLGLAITKNLVTLMGGTINVTSKVGQGSSFIVEIPFSISGQIEENYREKEFEDLKILVADDDRDTCEHTSIMLARLGVQAEWVLSGLEAVERTVSAYQRNDSFDIIFIDWKMPEVDGIEATRRIRKVVGPETLIIIISAYNWPEIEKEARLAGASAFISKPMFQSTLYNTLVTVTKKNGEHLKPLEKKRTDFAGKRFLLVEDNAFNLEIAQELLEMTGALIETAINGEIAVEMFLKSQPDYYDVVLMDVQMPIMDGYAATRAIRASAHPCANQVPIIAMTANAFSEDVAAALHAGMNAHIAKPIDIDYLLNVISGILSKDDNV